MISHLRAAGSWAFSFAAVIVRRISPDSRRRQLRAEVGFWRQWFASKGLEWPDDYAMRFDPTAPVQDYISGYIDGLRADDVEILDVGSGPVTKLGKIHRSKKLSITAIDVLAVDYNTLLAEFGVTPLVATQYGDAQELRRQFPNRRFDIVHAENSLDHTSEPVASVREMLAVTKPGGFVILLHNENEGRKQSYEDLHKWDFTCEEGHFVIRGPGPNGERRDVTEIFASDAEISCTLRDGEVLVAMRRRDEIGPGEYGHSPDIDR